MGEQWNWLSCTLTHLISHLAATNYPIPRNEEQNGTKVSRSTKLKLIKPKQHEVLKNGQEKQTNGIERENIPLGAKMETVRSSVLVILLTVIAWRAAAAAAAARKQNFHPARSTRYCANTS